MWASRTALLWLLAGVVEPGTAVFVSSATTHVIAPTPTVSGSATVQVVPAVAVITLPTSSASGGAVVLVPTAIANAIALAPSLFCNVVIAPLPPLITTLLLPPLVCTFVGTEVWASPLAASARVPVPFLSAGATVQAPPAWSTIAVPQVAASGSVTVQVVPLRVTAGAWPPEVYVLVNFTVPPLVVKAVLSAPLVSTFGPVFQVFYGTLFVGDTHSYALSCAEQKVFTVALTEKVVVDFVYR